MKLKIAAVAVTLAALAPVAYAAETPQPSFNDNAPISTKSSNVQTSNSGIPQPSFNG